MKSTLRMTIIAPPDALTSGKTEQVAQLLEQHVKKNGSSVKCIDRKKYISIMIKIKLASSIFVVTKLNDK